MEGVEDAQRHSMAGILVIGFGRFGQIVSQPLLASGCSISIIDNDTDMIAAAAISVSRSITVTGRGSTSCMRPVRIMRRSSLLRWRTARRCSKQSRS
jgi:voltage-gated potassium channel Kch